MLHILTTPSHTKTFCSRYKANNTVRKSELEIVLFNLQNSATGYKVNTWPSLWHTLKVK